jgi:hypothetical protein
MVEIPEVNYIAVLVATIVYWALGGLWYSPVLFQKQWMAAIGKTHDDLSKGMSPGAAMGAMFVVTAVSVIALSWLMAYAEVDNVAGALAIGVIVSFGFLLVPLASQVFFENRPWNYFMITFGYLAAGTILAAIILGLWA